MAFVTARAEGQTKTAADTASPELVADLAKGLGSTPAQAEGAAGTLFGIAKSRLSAGDFTKVAAAVPGMTGLLKAAPSSAENPLSSLAGGSAGAMGGLAAAAGAFSKLGLKPEMVSKAVPILTQFVTKSGGAGVGNLLSSVLK
jgi:hypothetical protein